MNPVMPLPLHLTLQNTHAAELSGTSSTADGTAAVNKNDEARLKEAAVQFESVLVRQMLSCLEKATSSPLGNHASGGSIYGSMVVNSVAEAVARAGGLGLSSLIVKSLQNQVAATSRPGTRPTTTAAGATQDEETRGLSSGSPDGANLTPQRPDVESL